MEFLLSLCAALSLCADAPKEPELYDYSQAKHIVIYSHYLRIQDDYNFSWGATDFCFLPFKVEFEPSLKREETAMRNERLIAHIYNQEKTELLQVIEPMIYETQVFDPDSYQYRTLFKIPFDGAPIHLKITLTKGNGIQQIVYEEDYNGMTTGDYFSEKSNCYEKTKPMHSGGSHRVYH